MEAHLVPLVPRITSWHLIIVLFRVSIAAMKHHNQKASWEKRVYLAYASVLLVITEGNRAGTHTGQDPGGSWRNPEDPEAGAEAEAMEKCGSLACFPWLTQSAFLENPGPAAQRLYHSPKAGPSAIDH